MIVGRLLAFCGLGMLVVMAMAYVAAHYPAPDTGHSPAGHMSGRTLAAPALSPATSADRRLEYGPVPAFVRPVSMPDPDTAEAELHGGARLLLADFQHDATNPQAGLYMRQVTQAVTGIGVATVSRYQVSIDPRYQTLVIHEATVIRDGERQSREGRIAADFLRQEPELADGVMTGMELAVLRIEDIRQGDILDIAYSVTGENPLLAPHQTRVFPLAAVPDIEQLSVRTTWPRGTAHAVAGPAGADEITVERRGSRTSFVLEPRRTRALAVEEGAPPEHVQIPVLMVSSWPDWASVAQWGRSFYQLPEHTDPDTAALAAHIRESYGVPARQLVAALEYVQDEIRYQAILLGDSTYVPAPPGETLRIRTGDCKAKTLLLLALLDALNLDANATALEVGPGDGSFLPELARRFARVVALDNSPAMLELAHNRCEREGLGNVELKLADALHDDCPAADCVVLNMVLHHLAAPGEAMKQLARLVKAGGSLLITELCSHNQSWAREACGDLWLGFEQDDLAHWADAAGLTPGESLYIGLKNGFQIQARHFSRPADNRLTLR